MAEFFTLLSNNSFAMIVILVAFVVVVLVFVISIFQGKEVSFWPPQIKPIIPSDPKPEELEDLAPLPNRILERGTYIDNIIKESLKSDNKSLILLSSGLHSRKHNEKIADLQDAWQSIIPRTSVKILAESNDFNLVGACELLSRGVSVRFFKSTTMTALSFHVFTGNNHTKLIINQKDISSAGNEATIVLESIAMAQIIERYFNDLWSNSVSIPQVLAAKINSGIPLNATLNQLQKALRDVKVISNADESVLERVRFRVALWRAAQYIFIIGPPGAGKTKVRNNLQEVFYNLGINSVSYADYPILYEFFLRETLNTTDLNNEKSRDFKPDKFGGFEILNPNVFDDAIQELKEICLFHSQEKISLDESAPIVLLEFARSNYLEALRKFGNSISHRSQIIYVTASPEIRASRIKGRSQKPTIDRKETNISILAGDEHYISEKAIQNLYSKDDHDRLKNEKLWASRLHVIDTDVVAEEDLEEILSELLKKVSDRVWQGKISTNINNW